MSWVMKKPKGRVTGLLNPRHEHRVQRHPRLFELNPKLSHVPVLKLDQKHRQKQKKPLTQEEKVTRLEQEKQKFARLYASRNIPLSKAMAAISSSSSSASPTAKKATVVPAQLSATLRLKHAASQRFGARASPPPPEEEKKYPVEAKSEAEEEEVITGLPSIVRTANHNTPWPFEYVEKPDILISYVENTPEHAARRAAALKQLYTDKNLPLPTDNEENRYDSSTDECKYVIRSIFDATRLPAPRENESWVGRILVLVDEKQYPRFLNQTCFDSKPIPVVVVPHTVFFKHKEQLPTYQSHSIEANIMNIPGERVEPIIYMNDDMFFSPRKFVNWSLFFTDDLLPRLTFTTSLGYAANKKAGNPKPEHLNKHDSAWWNTCELLEDLFPEHKGYDFCRQLHQATPLLRSVMEAACEQPQIAKALTTTEESKFREHNNVFPIGLFMYLHLFSETCEKANVRGFCIQVNDSTDFAQEVAPFVLGGANEDEIPDLFCVNDGLQQNRELQNVQNQAMLETMFPNSTPAELVQN